LQSAFYGLTNSKGKRYREMIDFNSNKVLVGDSGGFQLASYEKLGKVL
jgi:queuine/archaeosine tRNA-ribosyltransferase